MSLGTFLKRLWANIGEVFNRLGGTTGIIRLAHETVEKIKNFVDGPAGDIVVALIPGNADDRARDFLSEYLPRILILLSAVDVSQYENQDEATKAAVKKINNLPDDARKVIYHGVGALVTEKLSDEDVSWSDAIVLQEYNFKNKNGNVK